MTVNTTYMRVWDSSDIQWKYSKSYYQLQFLFPRAVLPGPFRCLYYGAKLVYYWKREDQEEAERQTEGDREDFTNYRKALLAMLRVKLRSDDQKLIQDDFCHLRQDIQNHFTEKLKKIKKEMRSMRRVIEEPRYEETKILREEITGLTELVKALLTKTEQTTEENEEN